MAQMTAVLSQTVGTNANIIFSSSTAKSCKSCIINQAGSGLVNLRGATNQCFAKYKISVSADVSGIAGATTIALSLNGEIIPGSTMTITPTTASDFWNVAKTIEICIPSGCCRTLTVKNTSTAAITVQNVVLDVDRIA